MIGDGCAGLLLLLLLVLGAGDACDAGDDDMDALPPLFGDICGTCMIAMGGGFVFGLWFFFFFGFILFLCFILKMNFSERLHFYSSKKLENLFVYHTVMVSSSC